MGWLNGFGALFVCLLLAPNVAFAMTHRDGFENRVQNRTLETLEQIGRFELPADDRLPAVFVRRMAVCRRGNGVSNRGRSAGRSVSDRLDHILE